MIRSLLLVAVMAAAPAPPIIPDPLLTPGVVLTTSKTAVCTPGYAGKTRNVSQSTKLDVYAAYKLAPSGRWRHINGARVWDSDFEVDHLISLQLGGSNDPANLWPQSYRTRIYNATSKDALENRLHWLVCHGQMVLTDAQRIIRDDWVSAYDAFVRGPVK